MLLEEFHKLKLYNEHGLESLKFRRWMRRRYMFYRTKTLNLPEYLSSLIPSDQHPYNTRKLDFAKT